MMDLDQRRPASGPQASSRTAAVTVGPSGEDAVALFNRAVDLHRSGHLAAAVAACGEAVARRPDLAVGHQLLGVLEFQAGRKEAALPHLLRAASLDANDPKCFLNLGVTLHLLGRHDQALLALQRALTIRLDYPEALHALATTLKALGRTDEAIRAYAKAISIKADYVDAYNDLGNLLQEQNRSAEAEKLHREACRIDPSRMASHDLLGTALQRQGRLAEAVSAYQEAIARGGDVAQPYSNLGAAFFEMGAISKAIAAYRYSIALDPGRVGSYSNLGLGLKERGRFGDAEKVFRWALRLAPGFADAASNLGNLCKDQARLGEAQQLYERAIALAPHRQEFHSNLLLTLNYRAELTPEAVYERHLAWGRSIADPHMAAAPGHPNDADPGRRLRIGYVSPDFRSHSVSYFFEPLLAAHDRDRFEIHCYADVKRPDETTARLKGMADGWRWIMGVGDAAVAQQVRDDRIDILVDLAGHTANARPLVFARKPAPVQVTWLGYPNTTGMAAMDARLCDAISDPEPGADRLNRERLVRLVDGFLSYAPPPEAPPVAPPPSAASGVVTFGSFNNLSKMTPQVVALWSRLLAAVPGSRLILKSKALADPPTRMLISSQFADFGISADRLDLRGQVAERGGHLGLYGEIDLALDPFPYNGTTTTCEALWMGVPVVTLEGASHPGRVGMSLLTRIGLAELIARDADDYVARARALVSDAPRLAAMRAGLRDRMAASALCAPERIARSIEAAYRDLWRGWCAGR